MAISFNTSDMGSTSSQLYTINEFKGCDYTTTPTLVNDNRAIEISNYLPHNNALIKRNGWEVVNDMLINDVRWKVHNIWRIKNHTSLNKEAWYIIYASDETNRFVLFCTRDLQVIGRDGELDGWILYDYGKKPYDTYSYGITFDGRLFILAQEDYIMVYFDDGAIRCSRVESEAYIPTIVTGLGRLDGIETPAVLEEFNLLSPFCYVELVQYDPDLIETTETITNSDGSTKTVKCVEYDLTPYFHGKGAPKLYDVNGYDGDGNLLVGIPTIIEGVGEVIQDIEYEDQKLNKFKVKIRDIESFSESEKGTIKYIKLKVFHGSDNIVQKMRFGMSYGSHGYRDRLFLAGNPEHPNMDIHSCETNDETANWKDYTYFGDLSYQMFGSDNQKITGYGLMSTGYMAVVKESAPNEPNLYLRNSDMSPKTVSDGVGGNQTIYVEQFPINVSGIKINVSSEAQIFNFGNDLLINIASGIYRVSATTSTAIQGYEVNEVSYFIRNDLGKDMSGSCSIVHNDKLYVCRKNADGIKRVYVADLNKYSFKDNVQIYDWWVLDNMNAEKMFIFDDILYFSDFDRGICKLGEEYSDKYSIGSAMTTINGVDYSKEVFMNTKDGTVFVAEDSKIIREIYKTNDLEKSYKSFKNKTKVSFERNVSSALVQNVGLKIYPVDTIFDGKTLKAIMLEEKMYGLIQYAYTNFFIISCDIQSANRIEANIDSFYLKEIGGINYTYVEILIVNDYKDFGSYPDTNQIKIPTTYGFDILEMYDENMQYALSECYIEDNTWYCQKKDELGNQSILTIGTTDTICFNRMKIGIKGLEVEFDYSIDYSRVVFHYNKPVESYWYSKYNDLGRLDFLKTATNISFVPDLNYGGYTSVGYKTSKNETSYYALAERPHIDFGNVDFENFFFGGEKMAKTYSSKKKIKNFSFIQLRLSSNDVDCSSIVSLSFRYKYTRNNKGVK